MTEHRYARIERFVDDMEPDHWVDYDPAMNVCRINRHRYDECCKADQRTLRTACRSLWEDRTAEAGFRAA